VSKEVENLDRLIRIGSLDLVSALAKALQANNRCILYRLFNVDTVWFDVFGGALSDELRLI
jgi:hypothetical protein